MPTLHWIGKEKVINHHLDVPFHTLKPEYTFGDAEAAKDNLIIHGDNLEALKALLPQYEGKVKVVCIDPLYNTGNESWVYNDNVNDPKIRKWLGQVVGKEGEDLSHRDNSDSEQKLKLGKAWESAAGRGFKYFMVFDQNPLAGAFKLEEFLGIARDL
jgi:hypothetical protein